MENKLVSSQTRTTIKCHKQSKKVLEFGVEEEKNISLTNKWK
jgi:hypothetical protein